MSTRDEADARVVGLARARGAEPQDPTDVGQASSARRGPLDAAMRAYTAAHGHPLEERESAERGARWAVSSRAVVAVAVALALVVGGLAVRSAGAGAVTTRPLGEVSGPTDGHPDDHPDDHPDGHADGAGEAPGDAAARPPDAGTAPAAERPGHPTDGATDVVVVHVVGQVAEPGLVRLPSGARLSDAVAAAGGATPEADLAAVNLARVVTDGEQVVVPAPGEVVPEATAAGGPATAAPTLVDLNTADAAALDGLPGVGPVLAERIVQWRADHGRFTTVEELTEVRGIGPALLADLRDLVRAG